MKALLLALALASAPAQAGGKKAQARAQAAAAEHQAQALQALQAGAFDQALAACDQAIAAHPAPPAELYLLRTTVRMNQDDLAAAAEDLRSAMATPLAPSEQPIAVVAIADLGTSLALGLATHGADPSQPLPEAQVGAALALLGEVEAFLGRSVADPRLRSIAARTRVTLLQVADRPGEDLLAAVDAALVFEPDTPDLLLARAFTLAGLDDLDGALAGAQRVLEQLPGEPAAHYLAASVHSTRAAQLRAASLDAADAGAAARLEAEALDQVLQSKPHLLAVHAADPDDLDIVRQLLQVALAEEDEEAVQRWQAEKARLGG